MSRLFFRIVLACFLALMSKVAFAAENVDVKANSGKTVIYSISIYNKFDCSFSEAPRYKIRSPAAHGSFEVEIIKARFKADHDRCPGKRVYALFVNYKPDRGFRGTGKAALDLRYPAYGGLNFQNTRTIRFNSAVK